MKVEREYSVTVPGIQQKQHESMIARAEATVQAFGWMENTHTQLTAAERRFWDAAVDLISCRKESAG